MSRTLIALVTAAWIAPLIGLACAYVYKSAPHGPTPGLTGGERTLGIAIGMFLIGVLSGLLTFAAITIGLRSYVPQSMYTAITVVDVLGILGWCVWGIMTAAASAQHDAPVYPGQRATLDVEIRAPKDRIHQRMSSIFFTSIGVGASNEVKHQELVRENGDFEILPVEVTVLTMHSWAIHLMYQDPRNSVWNYWFDLNLPDVPAGNVPWSDWIEPIIKSEYLPPDGITIRYRWTLTPEGETRVYRPKCS